MDQINWIVPVTATVLSFGILGVLYFTDKNNVIPNSLPEVQRPRELQTLKVGPDFLSAPLLYLPANASKSSSASPISIIFPGNPGVPEFYVDMMYAQRTRAQGDLHVYTLGHVGQGLILDEEKIPSVHQSPILPDSLPTAAFSSIPHPKRLFTLREVIAHKIAVLTEIRRRHPTSQFIWSGHSMGAFVIMTILRAMDDITSLILNGSISLPSPCTVSEVERLMPSTPFIPSSDSSLANDIVRISYTEQELQQWFDLVDVDGKLAKIAKRQNKLLSKESKESSESDPDDSDDTNEPTTHLQRCLTPESADGAAFVQQVQLLFPTVQRIADTPNGWNFTSMLQIARKGYLATITRFINFLPSFMVRAMLAMHFNQQDDVTGMPVSTSDADTSSQSASRKRGANRNIAACLLMMHSDSVANAGMLYKDEAETIRVLDIRLLEKHAHRLNFYFSKNDDWAPMYQAEHLQAIYEDWKANGKVTGEVIVDQHGLLHAFCTTLKGSILMGEHCIDKVSSAISFQE